MVKDNFLHKNQMVFCNNNVDRLMESNKLKKFNRPTHLNLKFVICLVGKISQNLRFNTHTNYFAKHRHTDT